MDMIAPFTVPGVVFLLTLVSGFVLSRLGKPYNGLLFNIHKLIALGVVIAASVPVVELLKAVGSPVTVVLLLIAAAVCVIALFASGALMSMEKLDYTLMRLIHRVAPIGFALAMGLTIHLLAKLPR